MYMLFFGVCGMFYNLSFPLQVLLGSAKMGVEEDGEVVSSKTELHLCLGTQWLMSPMAFFTSIRKSNDSIGSFHLDKEMVSYSMDNGFLIV